MHTCMQAHAQTHKHTHVLVHAHTDFEDMASLIPTNVFTLEINRTKLKGKEVNRVGQFGIGSAFNFLPLKNQVPEAGDIL